MKIKFFTLWRGGGFQDLVATKYDQGVLGVTDYLRHSILMVRFDKPCRSSSGAQEYFSQHLRKGDYLSQGGQSEMQWVGEGAARLGLSGHATQEKFARLCQGQDPVDGEKLGVRDMGTNRRVCYFGQISAPKDVSIAYLVGGDQRIEKWWNEAVKETLAEIEAVTATRVRQKGLMEDRVTGNMIAGIVTHDASRSLDPQLHTHLCIMNLTFDEEEKRWKGVQPSGFYRHQGYFREVCYNKLAEQMRAAGYILEKSRPLGFTIQGFPQELRERFSKRRTQIMSLAEKLGVSSQDSLQELAGSSRGAKENAEASQLREAWRKEAGDYLIEVGTTISKANGKNLGPPVTTAADSLTHAEAHVFERASVADQRVILREALTFSRGQVPLDQLKAGLKDKIASGEWIQRGDNATPLHILQMEREFTTWAKQGRYQEGFLGNAPPEFTHLGKEQLRAVRQILRSRDRVIILQGDAGTGKTTTLKEIIQGIESRGSHPFCCAPSSGAADILRKDLMADADTLQQLLVNPGLAARVRGQAIIVDEAGLISTRQMRDLCRLARENKSRLLLVGDIKQHSSVEAGDALRALQKFGGVEMATLRTIRRQIDAAYRKAVRFLATKKPYQAFRQFRNLGAVRQILDPKKLFAQAAADYVSTIGKGKSCLAISPVWSEIQQFTEAVRTRLRESKLIGTEERLLNTFSSHQWTRAERMDIQNYQAGDILAFHQQAAVFAKGELVQCVGKQEKRIIVQKENGDRYRFNPRQITSYDVGLRGEIHVAEGDKLLLRGNLKDQNLHNGDIVEVASLQPDGSISLKDGRSIPAHFHQFTYGYATTSHASQGKTVDEGIVIMSQAGVAAGNLKQAYVSHSRFRESLRLYVSDEKAAQDAFATDADRQLAMELVQKNAAHIQECQKLFEQSDRWQAQRTRVRASLKTGV